jgi:preprotein translocase subunit YajC
MSGPGILILIVGFGVLYLVLLRPQRRRRMDQERLLSSVKPGDEILTAGGIFGTVTSVADDEVSVEIAPGVEARVARRAVAGIVPPHDDEALDADEAPDALEAPGPDEAPDADHARAQSAADTDRA